MIQFISKRLRIFKKERMPFDEMDFVLEDCENKAEILIALLKTASSFLATES